MIPEKLHEIAEKVHNQSLTPQESVRSLLSWFGAKRRRFGVVPTIRRALDEVKLTTQPDFENVYIDSLVKFLPKTKAVDTSIGLVEEEGHGSYELLGAPPKDTLIISDSTIADPTSRIGQLESANIPPISVTPDAKLAEAITLMMIHDFSQLPVMQNERDVKGIITWETIGKKQFQMSNCQLVRDCMEITVPEVATDSSIFAAIDLIVKHGYILVRQGDRKISGIVTTSDLSLQFRQLAEPFLLVGEIENQIRRLIDGKYTVEQLKSAIDPEDSREVNSVSDLTFGEYLRILENPERWEALSVSVDRKIFVKYLDEIRMIRNDVMHFDPDPFEKEELEKLRNFAVFMRDLVVN